MNNQQRADSTAKSIVAYAAEKGLQNEDIKTQVGDLICDLLHKIAQAHEGDIQTAMSVLRNGLGHFLSEMHASGEDDLGPEAFVAIQANCAGNSWVEENWRL